MSKNKKDMNFCAIDFEKMTEKQTSVCSMGMVEVRGGVIFRKYYTLVKPVPDDGKCVLTWKHGIRIEDVENAPEWPDVYPMFMDFTKCGCIVFHNSATEPHVISGLCEHFGLPKPELKQVDTMKYMDGQPSLEKLCEEYHVSLSNHHDALADASACAEIVLAASGFPVVKPSELKGGMGFDRSVHKRRPEECKRFLREDEVENRENPFFHKVFLITGSFKKYGYDDRDGLMFLLHRAGGAQPSDSVTGKTDFLIVGDGAGPSKIKKANEKGVRIIHTEELIKMIDEYGLT